MTQSYSECFLNFLNIHNSQFPDRMVSPECDEQIPDEDELHLTFRIIRPGVVPDLGWIVGKLINKADQFPLTGLGYHHEERGGFG